MLSAMQDGPVIFTHSLAIRVEEMESLEGLPGPCRMLRIWVTRENYEQVKEDVLNFLDADGRFVAADFYLEETDADRT